jgi:hypothetical protein
LLSSFTVFRQFIADTRKLLIELLLNHKHEVTLLQNPFNFLRKNIKKPRIFLIRKLLANC